MTAPATPHVLGAPARFFLAAVVAVGLLVGAAASASAASSPAAQNAVGALGLTLAPLVGVSGDVSPAMSRDSYDSQVITASATGVAANSATSLVGRQYGVGTVVENPGLTIEGFAGASDPAHALNQVINRGLSPTVLRDTVANPRVVLQQGNGNFLYLSDDAAIVLRSDGQMVTAYGSADYRAHILSILADAAG